MATETWLLNTGIDGNVNCTVNFTSGNRSFYKIYYNNRMGELKYYPTDQSSAFTAYMSGWSDETYRTVVFDSPVTDATLLAWLQANGTKQAAPTISFKHRFKNDTLIGTGAYKFRRYSQTEPVVTPKGYKLTLTSIYLNAGQTVSIHMNNADGTSTADPYVLTKDTTLTYSNSCLTSDMMVMLADGSEKQICDLTSDDTYVAYDLATGDLVTAPAKYFDAVNGHSGKFACQYQKYTFEDGTVIKEVHKHRFLNITRMEFINLCHWEIGDRIYKMDGTTPALVSKEVVTETVEHFTVTTAKYHNGFVQGCLYGDRYTQRYEIQMVDGKPKYDFSKPHTVDYLYGKLNYDD